MSQSGYHANNQDLIKNLAIYWYVSSSWDNTRTIWTGNKENYIHTGKSVMQSAAEAECGALYMNTKEAIPMRITLEELGHPQPL